MTRSHSGTDSFDNRLRRLEKAHRKGYGFEAQGTLGRSSTYRRQFGFGKILRIVLIAFALGWVMKGVILFNIGETLYSERVAGLAMGNDLDPVAATIMAPDLVTRLVASFLGEVFP